MRARRTKTLDNGSCRNDLGEFGARPYRTLGAVVIGRNEGDRIRRSLRSALSCAIRVVYVDSGSVDASVHLAAHEGVEIVQLDPGHPFTAARARNEGFAHLVKLDPDIRYVQFVDGDCELQPGWCLAALNHLETHPSIGLVTGRLSERDRNGSIYSRLADMEWDQAFGEIAACGGVAMFRVEAFERVGGFAAQLAAGEEPELCFRLREQGYRLVRLRQEMAIHALRSPGFKEWWRRSVRSGRAIAKAISLHPRSHDSYVSRQWRQLASALVWGGAIPLIAVASALPTGGVSVIVLAAYPVLWSRIRRNQMLKGNDRWDASLHATACVIAKFPQVVGIFDVVRRSIANQLHRA